MKTRLLILLLSLITLTAMGQGNNIRRKTKPTVSKTAASNLLKKKSTTSKKSTKGSTRKKRKTYDYEVVDSVAAWDDDDYYYEVDTTAVDTVAYDDSEVFPDNGGYFEKDGDDWEEYRFDHSGVWATYTQYKDDDDFYYIQNDQCKVAVPKAPYVNNVYIWKNNDWTIAYYRAVTGTFYHTRGYFVAGNDEWTEYNDSKPGKIWNTYKMTSIDDNFYYLKNSQCEVAVPRNTSVNDFYIKKGDDWVVVYNHRQ